MIEVAATGRLGKPPEARVTSKGAPWKSLSLAVDAGGDEAEWISVSAFGEIADELPENLAPGERVYVEGKLRLGRWQAKSGEQRATLQVNATRVLVLDRIGRRRKTPRKTVSGDAPPHDEQTLDHHGSRERMPDDQVPF